jgi:trehalose 6-phosphate phosphatase
MLEPPLPDRGCAIFLDFDGTLAPLAPQPAAVRLAGGVAARLSRLSAALGGAVAVVSGRPVAEIDRLLQPLRLPIAGVHGVERRGADGRWHRLAVAGFDAALAPLRSLCERYPALLLEIKPGAVALHYRQAPALEDLCLATMAEAAKQVDGMGLLRGKMVVELKPRRAGKGLALRAFLDERPFLRRRPWFFGDDVTDEAGFEVVQALSGVAVKVGPGDTLAAHRLADPQALHDWLARALAALEPAREAR